MAGTFSLSEPTIDPPGEGEGGGHHLVNPKILLRVSVLSCMSVCCEALPLVSLVLWQDSLKYFLWNGT